MKLSYITSFKVHLENRFQACYKHFCSTALNILLLQLILLSGHYCWQVVIGIERNRIYLFFCLSFGTRHSGSKNGRQTCNDTTTLLPKKTAADFKNFGSLHLYWRHKSSMFSDAGFHLYTIRFFNFHSVISSRNFPYIFNIEDYVFISELIFCNYCIWKPM